MKVIKILEILFRLIAIILIPISLFEINGRTIIGVIAYGSVMLGSILSMINSFFEGKNNKNKSSSNKEE